MATIQDLELADLRVIRGDDGRITSIVDTWGRDVGLVSSKYNSLTGVVELSAGGAPIDVGGSPVSVTGANTVGSVLTAAPAQGWIVTGYQWNRDGVAIGGATSSTYTLVNADAGKSIGCNVTGLSYSTLALAIAGVFSAPTRLVATHGEVPLLSVTANTVNKVRLSGRSLHKIGKVAVTNIGASWVNYYIGASRVETNIATAVTVRAHFEIPGAPTPVVTVTFSSASSGVMPIGVTDFPCDLIPASAFGLASIPAGQTFYVVTEYTVALNEFYPAGPPPQESGESATYGSGATSKIGIAGALGAQEGGAITSAMPCPSAIIGKTESPIASAIFLGDSLVYGTSDGAANGGGGGVAGGGVYARAAWDIGSGYALPFARQAQAGSSAAQAAANYTKQSAMWAYATHLLCNLGTNDSVAASAMTNLRIIWAAAKTAGIQRVEQVQITNRSSATTDAWATVANQTVRAGYENAGTYKNPLNASIAANVGSNGLDAYLNINANWADPTVTDKIRAPGYTTDGTHYNATAAAAMAPDAAARFASWTAT